MFGKGQNYDHARLNHLIEIILQADFCQLKLNSTLQAINRSQYVSLGYVI